MVAICDIGLMNAKSLQRAFESLGQLAIISHDTEEISCCDYITLPGIGSFEQGVKQLRKYRIDRTLRAAAAAGKPVLGIGLGMQILCRTSQEEEIYKGVGLLPYDVISPKGRPTMPIEGFYSLQSMHGELFAGVEDNGFWFSQQSFIRNCEGASATVEYEGSFCAAVLMEKVAGVQFYPEKSGESGLRVLSNFLKLGEKQ